MNREGQGVNIEETHQFLEYKIETARGDTRSKPEVVRADIARAYRTAKTRADELLHEAEASVAKQNRALRRKAFVPPPGTEGGDARSRRDAADRAAMIEDPREAAEILRRAEDHGDVILAAAVAERAYDQAAMVGRIGKDTGWSTVLGEYTAERPTVRETLAQLADVPDMNNPAHRMQLAMRYAVQKPSEIEHLSDAQITALADSED
ncbi:hypothetical protein [Actinomadura chokoriensis]|uniref:DUF222 domain-containing protein n=1 Tax=Actinomadura chokoriensis TaxID=454156 RepID=A0ABV4R996_9ACTN